MHWTFEAAYGRTYSHLKFALTDLNGGKDFMIANVTSPDRGRYISLRDLKPGDTVELHSRGSALGVARVVLDGKLKAVPA